MSGSLWDWACARYERPGVADLCLDLQDRHGQSAPLLLWAAWSGVAAPSVTVHAAQTARRWEAVVGPLRSARRALRDQVPPIPDAGRERLRSEVQAAELAAERLLLDALERLAPPSGASPATAALQAAADAWGIAAPVDRLAALAAALG